MIRNAADLLFGTIFTVVALYLLLAGADWLLVSLRRRKTSKMIDKILEGKDITEATNPLWKHLMDTARKEYNGNPGRVAKKEEEEDLPF